MYTFRNVHDSWHFLLNGRLNPIHCINRKPMWYSMWCLVNIQGQVITQFRRLLYQKLKISNIYQCWNLIRVCKTNNISLFTLRMHARTKLLPFSSIDILLYAFYTGKVKTTQRNRQLLQDRKRYQFGQLFGIYIIAMYQI